MCNLYRLNKPAADIAHLFGVEPPKAPITAKKSIPVILGW
jgi:hypothetical protein